MKSLPLEATLAVVPRFAAVLSLAFLTVGRVASAEQPPSVKLPASEGEAAPPPPQNPPPQPEPQRPPPGEYLPPPPGYGPSGGYVYDGPPPPPPIGPYSRKVRDGFYVRLGLGLVSPTTNLSFPRYGVSGTGAVQTGGIGNTRLTGTGFGVDAAVGGNLRPGLALAFEFGGHDVGSPTTTNASIRPAAVSYSRLGAMLDFYPDPKRGFHVQGGAGLATLSFLYPDRSDSVGLTAPGTPYTVSELPDVLRGVAWHAGLGYEWWAGRDWSMGMLFRVDGASVSATGQTGSFKGAMLAPGMMFSVTLN